MVSISSRSSARVSNSLADFASSSSSGGSTGSLISLTVTSAFFSAPSGPAKVIVFVSPAFIPRSPRSSSSSRRPAPSCTTKSRCASPDLVDEVDDQDVAVLRRAVLDGNQLGDRRTQCFQLLIHELSRHLGLRGGDLEGAPVSHVRKLLHRHLGREVERLVVGRRHVVRELGLRDGPDPRVGCGVQEPAADVALDCLREDPVAAEPRHQDLSGNLALAEARDLRRLGEIGGGVLDRVLDVGARHLHLEADSAVGKLLDLCLQGSAILPARVLAGISLKKAPLAADSI